MELRYVPVMFGQMIFGYMVNNKRINWWSDDALIKYPYGLINAYHNSNTSDIRSSLKITDGFFVYGDSGGFQQLTLGKPINPMKVYEWQKNNVNIGFIKDFPITSNMSKDEIERNRELTLKNAKIMYDLHVNGGKDESKYNMELWGVLFGPTVDDIIKMKEEYDKIGEWDGFAIGSIAINYNTQRLAIELNKIIEYLDVKRIHLLGVSSLQLIEYIYQTADKKLDLLSFDSSAFERGARFRAYNIYDFDEDMVIGDKEKSTFHNLPCGCPVCIHYKNIDKSEIVGSALSLHNLFWMIHRFDVYNAIKMEHFPSSKEREYLAKMGIKRSENNYLQIKGII